MTGFKILVGSLLTVMPLVVFTDPADAQVRGPIHVRYDVNNGRANFTNCPSTPTEVTCIGTGVEAYTVDAKVDSTESHTRALLVNEFVVYFHPDGSFELGDMIATGSGRGHLVGIEVS